jgi:hypothetical protein
VTALKSAILVSDQALVFSDAVGRTAFLARSVTDTVLSFSETLGRLVTHGVADWALGGFVGSDTFSRTITAGTTTSWGTVENGGQAWTIIASVATCTYSVNGAAAVNSIVAGNASRRGQTVTVGSSHQEALVEFALDTIPVGAAYAHSVMLRGVDTNNMYSANALITVSGAIQYRFRRIISNVGTNLLAATNVPGIGTYTAGTFVWVRARIEGNYLAIKIWKDGTAEPAAWSATVLDSVIASGTLVGAGGQGNTSITNALNESIDNFSVVTVFADTLVSTQQHNISDTALSFSDSVTPSRSYQRPLADTALSFSDTVSTSAHHNISVNDQALTFSDSVNVSAGSVRTVSDAAMSFSDTLAHTPTREIVDRAVSFADALQILRAREILDTGLLFSDSVTISGLTVRNIADTVLSFSDFVVATRPSHGGAPPLLAQII